MPSSPVLIVDAFLVQICPPARFLVRQVGQDWEVVCDSLEAAMVFAVTLLAGARGEMTLSDTRGVPFLNLFLQRNMAPFPDTSRVGYPKFDATATLEPPAPPPFLKN
jgi:hypothetical protein